MVKLYHSLILFTILCIPLFSNDLQACQVDYQYNSYSNNGSVTFTSTTTDATNPTYIWDFGDGTSGSNPNELHIYSATGTYPVCLTIIDEDNCMDMICYDVSVINHNGTDCELNDCVYPGDTNKDGSANIYDLFSIGMHFGDIGPARDDADESWYAQPAQDWPLTCINGNLKHTDANGDGIIDSNDLDPIISNYYNDHSYTSNPSPLPNSAAITLEFTEDSIIIDNENPENYEVGVDIIIGSADAPAIDIYALALSLNFSEDIIEPGSISVEYYNEGFFCDSENVLFMSKATNDGMVDLGFSRTNQIPVAGFGKIARVNFTIIGDIVVSRSPEDNILPLAVEAQGTMGINDMGQDLGIHQHGDMMTFQIDQSSGLKENIDQNLFQVSPNPTTGMIRMEFDNYSVNQFEVYSTTGQVLMSRTIQNANFEEIDLSTYPNGTYYIKVSSDESIATKKVVLAR